MTTADYRAIVYGHQADHEERGPHLNELATGRAANLTAGWGVYNGQTIPIYDARGRRHMITDKQNRIYLWAMGTVAGLDTTVRLRDVAGRLEVSVNTVRLMLQKLMAWGRLAYWSYRGRYGKTVLWPRVRNDGLERFADYARAKIAAIWDKIRARSNVRTVVDRDSESLDTGSRDSRTLLLSSSSHIRIAERDDRIEEHLRSLQVGSMKRVPCPAHEGEGRNLAFWRRPDGSLGVKCWSHQCDTRAIKDAVEPW